MSTPNDYQDDPIDDGAELDDNQLEDVAGGTSGDGDGGDDWEWKGWGG